MGSEEEDTVAAVPVEKTDDAEAPAEEEKKEEAAEEEEEAAPQPTPKSNELVLAASLNDLDAVRRLVEQEGANVNDSDSYGDCALAASVKHERVVRYLLKQEGVEVNRQNQVGSTALHKAAQRGDVKIVRMLVKAGADASVRNASGLLAEQLARDERVWKALLGESLVEERVEVPKSRHGSLVGKGGSRLQELQLETGCRVKMPHRDSQSTAVQLSGRQEAVAAAKARIEAFLQAASAQQRGGDFRDGDAREEERATARIHIPKESHKLIVGKGARTLRDIQAEFSVRIVVPRANEEDDLVIIHGAAQRDVELAHARINDIIAHRPDGQPRRGGNRGNRRGGPRAPDRAPSPPIKYQQADGVFKVNNFMQRGAQ